MLQAGALAESVEMGYDYALVHLYYTIPPSVALSLLYRPFFTSLDVYKILFLITISVVSTIPWDSYLIHHRIWTYPPNAIVGPTLFDIPAEEVFFFVIQTYNTSLLYIVLSKPTFHPIYLRGAKDNASLVAWKWLGQIVLACGIVGSAKLVVQKGEGLYMGLIIFWAGPFVLLLWSLAYQFIIGLPWTNTLLPIALPTLYLWLVDTLALRRGTWVIESGTKIGWHLWDGLEIEEAIFFLVTNILIVFGLVAFDNAVAIIYTFPAFFPLATDPPSPVTLIKALLLPASSYDESRIHGLGEALQRLKKKSRSFYMASGVFQGQLRIDMVLLYSFCRVADDLVDNAETPNEARHWIRKLDEFLNMAYGPRQQERSPSIGDWIQATFPPNTRSTLVLLPTTRLSPQPLHDLLKGFETDLDFESENNPFPIKDESHLQVYATRVAATVAEACIELVYYHTRERTTESQQRDIIQAGARMGAALQYVNIARDISVDARIQRVYLPTSWLKEVGMSPEDILRSPEGRRVEALRKKLLDRAREFYDGSRNAIDRLPLEARGPMKVAVECYMEIGRVLQKPGYKVKAGRATVPKLERLKVAWKAMSS